MKVYRQSFNDIYADALVCSRCKRLATKYLKQMEGEACWMSSRGSSCQGTMERLPTPVGWTELKERKIA